ncbi:hypothetical protein AYI69_g7423 [Smittium culicis]|uniref:Uncharacterized protein n=1 Tax=Smittium culicis TaxID=133412 RepID=A0A1R1XS34_9FUNG|nr:hypothetical protein AYI69_g7423 [Smittium culicis]
MFFQNSTYCRSDNVTFNPKNFLFYFLSWFEADRSTLCGSNYDYRIDNLSWDRDNSVQTFSLLGASA